VWAGVVPGRDKLSREFGVSGKTVEAALRLLEKRGVLESAGAGKRRRIKSRNGVSVRGMKLAILSFDPLSQCPGYLVELQHMLVEAGHAAFFAPKSQAELGNSLRAVSRFVKQTKADAWVLEAASREVLEWFIKQDIPVFALFGRRRGLPIAGFGPEKSDAYAQVARRFYELGHRRIVLLARRVRRLPEPGTIEKAFLGELEAQGIETSSYNLPDWEENVRGFHERLNTMFLVNPPTALLIDEAQYFLAALHFCASRGLRVPGHVSLACTDDDPGFAWFTPKVAHIRWDRRAVLLRITRWAANVSQGKADRRQSFTKAEFVEGGTIGPVRR